MRQNAESKVVVNIRGRIARQPIGGPAKVNQAIPTASAQNPIGAAGGKRPFPIVSMRIEQTPGVACLRPTSWVAPSVVLSPYHANRPSAAASLAPLPRFWVKSLKS